MSPQQQKGGKYNGFGYNNIKIYPACKNKFKKFIMLTYSKLIPISEKNRIFKYMKTFIMFIEHT